MRRLFQRVVQAPQRLPTRYGEECPFEQAVGQLGLVAGPQLLAERKRPAEQRF